MRNLSVLLQKEWLEYTRQRGLLFSSLAVPLLLTVVAIGVMIGVRAAPTAGDNADVARQLMQVNPALAGMSLEDASQAVMGQTFSTMFLLIPLILPSIIASYCVVGEKLNRTLEPLLATPVETWELLAGKILAALIPSMVLTWACGALYIASVWVSARSPRVFAAIVSPGWLTVFLACTPLLALIAIAVMVAVSSRVNDPRTAQQFSAWVIVPFLGVFFGQLTGVLVLSPPIALGAAGVLVLVAGLAVWGATRIFQREVILTRWT
jgi:ABC-2 type transport system permease protein